MSPVAGGEKRRSLMLQSAMGAAIAEALADPLVAEVMVNADGSLRLDRLGQGIVDTGLRLPVADVERIIRLIATQSGTEIDAARPILSAALVVAPDKGRVRFEGLLPPVAAAPCFSIRKPATRHYGLAAYVRDRIMTPDQAGLLRQAVWQRRNILIAGGTSSGKTTLANALLAEIARCQERIIVIEDTRELVCDAADHLTLCSRPGIASLRDLVRSSLRLRPDRIVIGEVRGAEALDLLKAWNTGHPGGIATLHANSAAASLQRLEQLVQEAVPHVPRGLIAEAIDLIVFLAGKGAGRHLAAIESLDGIDADGRYRLRRLAAAPAGTCTGGA
ncbi:P-type conjugative transfer ATPase TrbB [Ferrovibrio sp.]|uniref:P-type conjugative transfer ATPase TrbB n=1 Tax=Ferrovibrio sp. TaxID=1917215 RepID=UPI0039C893B7